MFENSSFTPENVRAGASFLAVVARLRTGETISPTHNQNLIRWVPRIAGRFPAFTTRRRFTVRAASLKESLAGPLRTSLLVLLAGVGVLLLIGCTNLASLLLARATARRKEMAVRRAVGASRGHMVRQLLAESLLLSFIGGGIGIALAATAPRFLRLLPAGSLPRRMKLP